MTEYQINKKNMPMIPLRGLWIYPHMVMHFDVGRSKSVKAIEASLEQDSKIFLVTQIDFKEKSPGMEDLYKVGVIANIKQTLKLPGGSLRVLVEGESRAGIKDLIDGDYLSAEIEEYIYKENPQVDTATQALMRLVKEDLREFEKYNRQANIEVLMSLGDIEEPGRFADTASSYVQFDLAAQMEILSELDTYKRLEKLHEIFVNEISLLEVQDKIDEEVKRQIDESQKEYYLREQIEVIKKELGEKSNLDDAESQYRKLMEEKDLPAYVIEAANKELDKLAGLNPNSPEINVSRTYLDYLLDLPWGEYSQGEIDLDFSKKTLNADHYGMEEVKDRILEYVAVMKKTGKIGSQILCFVGPPGVGKTSISKSIAKALDRSFVSMRLGGVRDEAEIRGHRRTYIASMPGKIIKLLTDAKTMNPVFLLDEIDKLSQDFKGDPASALLEVLDPAQNDEFRDHFLDLPVDLSEVIFITTANSLSTIPSALLDRMEVISLEGYTYEEKFNIAKRHLVPRVLEDHGLTKEELSISDGAMKILINNYTRESGVRELERMISRLARRAVRKMLEEDKEKISITARNLADFAGQIIYLNDESSSKPEVGLVTGLAWTSVGGVILNIEANVLPGSSKLQLTGKLGEVMKESAWAGLSYIRANYKKFGIKEDFYSETDIHIHIPEGATPKDGPSAGITMATAMVSALTGKKVRNDVAMTGEITITGRVLAIGGVKEKLLAAKRQGINEIILPKANERDIKEMKAEELKEMEIFYVESFDEVVDMVIIDED